LCYGEWYPAECILHKDSEDDEQGREYDLVFACDLFAYIGDLRKMFCTVRKSLESKGGIFAFSAEIVNECEEIVNECGESKLIWGLYCNHVLDLHINAGTFDH